LSRRKIDFAGNRLTQAAGREFAAGESSELEDQVNDYPLAKQRLYKKS
jgi:hypothetical protein